MVAESQSGVGERPRPIGHVTIGDSKLCRRLGIPECDIPFWYLIDIRLCTIAGILCSLNLLDSGILASAAVTSMLSDLGLDQGNRFSVCIFISTISSIICQLPSTIAVRKVGPRPWFAFITTTFGLITLLTAWIQTWQQLLALRILLGAATSGIYPGLTYLISTWYKRDEQQTRYGYMHVGEVIILATGTLVNYTLNQNANGYLGLAGWRWMFIVQGACTIILGIFTYWWMVDFPEHSFRTDYVLYNYTCRRINEDRGDLLPTEFSWREVLINAEDFKVWAFAVLFFLQNMVTVALAYFVPIILRDGLGFSANKAIVLSSPPYYFAVVPVLLSSWAADRYKMRAPCIVFNTICMIIGFSVLGFAASSGSRYFGVFLATGAYVANWAALSAYQANNISGQWKRVFTAALCTMFNGAGGIAGSFIVRSWEAPWYTTAVWVSIGSQILLLAIVLALTVFFFLENKRLLKAQHGSSQVRPNSSWKYTL